MNLNKLTLQTSEDGTNDQFEVSLKTEPTSEVEVWVDSSNSDEAQVWPLRILFCPDGFTELFGRCETIADAEQVLGPITEVHWSRTSTVQVYGTKDGVDDGDANYTITFFIESADATYAPGTNDTLTGVNTDVTFAPSIAAWNGLNDDALLQAIQTTLGSQVELGYGGANGARTAMLSSIDLINNEVACIYTGRTIQQPRDTSGAGAKGINTEHSWPQSQFSSDEPMRSDLHHLFPSDSNANQDRSNYDYGWVAASTPAEPNSVVGPNGIFGNVYQVRPERRGDVARAHFYMVARYRFDNTIPATFDDDGMTDNGSINATEEGVLREWHMADPPDALERQRNFRIEAYQGARNPFVDFPELVGRISDF